MGLVLDSGTHWCVPRRHQASILPKGYRRQRTRGCQPWRRARVPKCSREGCQHTHRRIKLSSPTKENLLIKAWPTEFLCYWFGRERSQYYHSSKSTPIKAKRLKRPLKELEDILEVRNLRC